MNPVHLLKASALSITLALATTGAKAHDQTDCELYGEATCDEITDTPLEWENCAVLVAVECYGHAHQSRPLNVIDQLVSKHEDERVSRKIELQLLKLQQVERDRGQ